MKAANKIKSQLKRVKPQLASKYGVNEIGLFGSITRDDFSTDSDADIGNVFVVFETELFTIT